MIKKSPPYPIEEKTILTKAPKNLDAAYKQSRKTADPEVVIQPSDGKTLEDPMEYDLGDKKVAWSSILSLIAVFALGLIAAGGIILALYNCVAHP